MLLPEFSQRLTVWRMERDTAWKRLNGFFNEGIQNTRGEKVLHALTPLVESTAASQVMTDSVSGAPDSENPGGAKSNARLIIAPELPVLNAAKTINLQSPTPRTPA